MAIVFEYYEPQGKYRLAVWKSEKSDGESDLRLLSPREAAEYATFKSPSRKREFLAVRRLVRQLAGDSAIIRYDSDGAPQLEDGRSLSITHSGDCVGVMTGETGRMGIDLETIRENIDRIVQKFMDDAEQASFGSLLTPEAMHVIWCAKEILFKIYRKGGIDFRKDLEVKPTTIRETGVVEAMIRK
ncbi:MAG: hypothetical protein RL021_528, partial [Bacteroidota bacterium]